MLSGAPGGVMSLSSTSRTTVAGAAVVIVVVVVVAGAEVAFSLLPHAAAVGITSTTSSATITARVFVT